MPHNIDAEQAVLGSIFLSDKKEKSGIDKIYSLNKEEKHYIQIKSPDYIY